jgi:hypothetical protein
MFDSAVKARNRLERSRIRKCTDGAALTALLAPLVTPVADPANGADGAIGSSDCNMEPVPTDSYFYFKRVESDETARNYGRFIRLRRAGRYFGAALVS